MFISRSRSPEQQLILPESPRSSNAQPAVIKCVQTCGELPATSPPIIRTQKEIELANTLLLLSSNFPAKKEENTAKKFVISPSFGTNQLEKQKFLLEGLATYPTVGVLSLAEKDEARAFVCDSIRNGMSQNDIRIQAALKYHINIPPVTISRWSQDAELLSARDQKRNEEKQKVLAMRGCKVEEIESLVTAKPKTIKKWLKEAEENTFESSSTGQGVAGVSKKKESSLKSKQALKALLALNYPSVGTLSTRNIQEIKKLVRSCAIAGMSTREIRLKVMTSYKVNVSIMSINRWSKKASLQYDLDQEREILKQKVLEMRHLTVCEIATQLELKPYAIRKWLREFGTKIIESSSQTDEQGVATQVEKARPLFELDASTAEQETAAKILLRFRSNDSVIEQNTKFKDLSRVDQKEIKTLVLGYLRSGMTQEQSRLKIMKDRNVIISCSSLISRWAKINGVPSAFKEKLKIAKEQALEMRGKKEPVTKVAAMLNVKPKSVWLWYKEEEEKEKRQATTLMFD